MPPKTPPPEPANQEKERGPKDLRVAANYRQWLSFEGCYSPATEPAVESILQGEAEPETKHERVPKARLDTLRDIE